MRNPMVVVYFIDVELSKVIWVGTLPRAGSFGQLLGLKVPRVLLDGKGKEGSMPREEL
jgi:hypothetical protein